MNDPEKAAIARTDRLQKETANSKAGYVRLSLGIPGIPRWIDAEGDRAACAGANTGSGMKSCVN